jgi:hypothetical protein
MTNERTLAEAIMAFIRAFIAAIFGGVREAGASLYGDAKRLAGVAKAAVDRTTAAVGSGLEGPARTVDAVASGIGGLLGSLTPRGGPHASDVAEAALANDNRVAAGSRGPAMSLGELVLAHNRASMDPSGRAGRDLAPLPRDVAAWLAGLDTGARCNLAFVPAARVERHIRAESLMEIHGALPLMPALQQRLDADTPPVDRVEEEVSARRILEESYRLLETPESHMRVASFRM